MSYQHLGFDLFECFEYYAAYDDDGCSTKGHVCSEVSVEEDRNDCDDAESDCADEDDVPQNGVEVICGGLAGSYSRDKSALFLHIVGDFDWIKGNRCVEVSKQYGQCKIDDQTDGVLPVVRIAPVILAEAVENKACSSAGVCSQELFDYNRKLQ